MTKILFLGNGPLADSVLNVLQKHYDIVFHARTKTDLDTVKKLKENHPELHAILASYGIIIPQDVLELFEPEGIINIHPSKLPEYRGPSPIESAILNGATDFSVSIMKLTKDMDAGDLYYQETLHNLPLDKSIIYQKLSEAGAKWLINNLDNLPIPVKQDHKKATYTHKFTKTDGQIDPNRETSTQIYRKIVAFQGFPKVKYPFYGQNCIILTAHPMEQGDTAPIVLKCANSSKLAIDCLQPEGKRPMDAKSFLNGYKK
ncbi:hypothetical protein IJG04_01420 [Candidatus Saccharibacteria bacterium]|nr:hypothetical protein [Candidatus Saccharibacteria bacterium]